ncbi:hypothetical protein QE394_001053 [Arthrobacter sp. SORGH_AS 212]|uniref:hypothetical protein n=1 Tax=Pseudarthrobacter sp. SORGH_AS 212 TaxID=3041777 RepID=UPI00277E1D57|nr:hypothetical protein [Arthrobacter sp. SORGH_AS_0212]
MPKLPGDPSKNRVTDLKSGFNAGGKSFVKKGAAAGGSAKGKAASASTGRFVSKSENKKNPTSGAYEIVNVPPGVARSLIHKALKGKAPRPAPPVTVRVYLDTDDAVTSVKVIKAITDVLASAGYGKSKIENVEKGSVRLRIKAWLDGEDGQKAQQVGKQKLGEAAGYMEQWAKDATVNKQRAEISAINAQTAQALIESVKDIGNIALQMDEWLIVKYMDASGKSNASVRKLTVVELQLIERSPGLLNEPAKVLENLSMLAYQEQHGQVALEG